MGPDEVATRYGAPAESLQRYEPHARVATGSARGHLAAAPVGLSVLAVLAGVTARLTGTRVARQRRLQRGPGAGYPLVDHTCRPAGPLPFIPRRLVSEFDA